ncbi:hypothetical protein B8W69_14365 [Mycobacterium vulneris]|uniref:SnoaL-like domain-containing protein n=1 Tax=Mycolicibacterium vulneris TaxID=547163 RepID=A0A1X2L057_9MYCO|nr:hypothetical protein B8W69_14365 [Mycolicibacterium vulneris]
MCSGDGAARNRRATCGSHERIHPSRADPFLLYSAYSRGGCDGYSLGHARSLCRHLDGDTAHAESYVIVVLIGPDAKSTQFITGRYIDRLERRNGQWRIAVRRSTVEGMFIAGARVLRSSFFTEKGYLVGTRDRADLSYQRPLTIDAPAPARW